MHDLWSPAFPLWHFVVRATVVYVLILVLLRLGGKRQVGQMGAADFVVLLLISNAVQNAMNAGDNSVTSGVVLASTLVALGAGMSYLTFRSKRLEALVEGTPRVLIHHGRLIQPNLDRERLSLRELRTKLRHLDVHALEDVHEAILESDGSLSVIRKSELAKETR